MSTHNHILYKLYILIAIFIFLSSCTAGNPQFSQDTPAGFWYGLWHGIISVISLIIHVFNENISVYEINNTGGWYDFGFLLGVTCIWGGSSHVSCKTSARKQRDKEWEEVGEKVELKVMRKLKEWAKDEKDIDSSEDWDEISEKVELKLKRKIREWAEKD